jgi:hypothetical protein
MPLSSFLQFVPGATPVVDLATQIPSLMPQFRAASSIDPCLIRV